MKKLFLFALSILLLSCNQPNESSDLSKNKEIFNKNVLTIKEMLNGFYEEDSEKFMSVFADSVRWSGPEKIKLNDYESKEVLESALRIFNYKPFSKELISLLLMAFMFWAKVERTQNPSKIYISTLNLIIIALISCIQFSTYYPYYN